MKREVPHSLGEFVSKGTLILSKYVMNLAIWDLLLGCQAPFLKIYNSWDPIEWSPKPPRGPDDKWPPQKAWDSSLFSSDTKRNLKSQVIWRKPCCPHFYYLQTLSPGVWTPFIFKRYIMTLKYYQTPKTLSLKNTTSSRTVSILEPILGTDASLELLFNTRPPHPIQTSPNFKENVKFTLGGCSLILVTLSIKGLFLSSVITPQNPIIFPHPQIHSSSQETPSHCKHC